jgi:hypothetical protein
MRRLVMKRVIYSIAMLALSANLAWTQTAKQNETGSNNQPAAQNTQPGATVPPVTGAGTPGRLSKWAAASALCDSLITEDKNGNVGIGTATPTSPLTVHGTVETFRSGVLNVANVAAGDGSAIVAAGGNGSGFTRGGSGLLSLGGTGTNSAGGPGLIGEGGNATGDQGGPGGALRGGDAISGSGGDGAIVVGGEGVGTTHQGGRGLFAIGGQGLGGATNGSAAQFIGNVEVAGTLSKGGGSFKIDHPLDPANKYLYHSFVESPDMKNIYDGNIATDQNGEAVVELPEWFEALNKGFRYQLTVIGTFAQAIVAEKVKGNRFTIRTSAPNVEVSWQVTGIRKDAFADKHRIPVEEMKPEIERGYYLYPDAFDQPAERSIEFVRHGDVMRKVKAASETAQKEKKD